MTRRSPTSRRCRNDGGTSDALGLALMAPAAIALALVILLLSRQIDSRATAQSAAEAAAQAAAQERTPEAAVAAGRSVAEAMLVDEQTCESPDIDVDVSSFHNEIEPLIRVSVSCTPTTAGLESVGAPGLGDQRYTAFAAVDPFRGAEP